jgi:hypothetical protein
MSSPPAEEIVVTTEPLPSSPPHSIERPISPDISPSNDIHHDPNSKKSFKRKYILINETNKGTANYLGSTAT